MQKIEIVLYLFVYSRQYKSMEYASYLARGVQKGVVAAHHQHTGKEYERQQQQHDKQNDKKHISWAEQLVSMEYIAYSKKEYDRCSWSYDTTVVQGGLPDGIVHCDDFDAGIGLNLEDIMTHELSTSTTTTSTSAMPIMIAPVRRTKPIGGFYFMGVAGNHGRRTITHNPHSFLSINQPQQQQS